MKKILYLVLSLVMSSFLAGCAGWAKQVKSDLERVMPECTTESAITACQCAARVLRDQQCRRVVAGQSMPPACRDYVPNPAPASQP